MENNQCPSVAEGGGALNNAESKRRQTGPLNLCSSNQHSCSIKARTESQEPQAAQTQMSQLEKTHRPSYSVTGWSYVVANSKRMFI